MSLACLLNSHIGTKNYWSELRQKISWKGRKNNFSLYGFFNVLVKIIFQQSSLNLALIRLLLKDKLLKNN